MLRGVISVTPGYAGGETANPTYEQVCSGRTGHAEVIKVEFDPAQIAYRDLLTVFFATHDPTTRDRQGPDVGTQYRSIILYTTDDERRMAETFIRELNGSSAEGKPFDPAQHKPIVTEVKPLDRFYEAEGYHRQYYRKNQSNRYCELVINPKLNKVQQQFAELLKSHGQK